ncbi:MAG: thymidine kinase [Deltaproteobacteria bacterium]|nr:MAG: thymidine kinase [Deltaproteobacteria bacterium]
MHPAPKETGWIEVICGPMFSGKTEELIRRITRARIARQRVQVFKPAMDDRYHATRVVTHEGTALESLPVADAEEILSRVDDRVQVVGIDEAQFFGGDLVEVAETLANRGVRVIVAGLDQDYRGVPFGPMPALLAVAEFVTKQLAICMVCGNPAGRSQRLTAARDQVVVGAQDVYEARCRRCFDPEGDPFAGRRQQLPLAPPRKKEEEEDDA